MIHVIYGTLFTKGRKEVSNLRNERNVNFANHHEIRIYSFVDLPWGPACNRSRNCADSGGSEEHVQLEGKWFCCTIRGYRLDELSCHSVC